MCRAQATPGLKWRLEPSFLPSGALLSAQLPVLGASGGVGWRAGGCPAGELVAARGLRQLAGVSEPRERGGHGRAAQSGRGRAAQSGRAAVRAGPGWRQAAVKVSWRLCRRSGVAVRACGRPGPSGRAQGLLTVWRSPLVWLRDRASPGQSAHGAASRPRRAARQGGFRSHGVADRACSGGSLRWRGG
jgi:hypothetical protein